MRIPIIELTVFICGAVFMIYELVGSRILGPYFGTSLYVWTNLIGIFLGSLSIGYYLGGQLADRYPRLSLLGYLVFVAGVLIALTLLVKDPWLSWISKSIPHTGLGSAIASIILFLPASLVLGTISPLAGKLKIHSLSSTGSSLGTLYALSTTGSIIGTYLAGFWLIPTFGTNHLLLLLAAILILLSLLITSSQKLAKVLGLAIIILGWQLLTSHENSAIAKGFVDVDTGYNRVWIYEGFGRDQEQKIRVMGINAENHSSMYLDSPELVNEYTKYFHLASHFVPNLRAGLMLGGAGYSYPKEYLRVYPESTLDVVEIDPGVTTLARQYFGLVDDPRLSIIHQDARVFLNQSSSQYDVIFGDVFSSRYAPPFHLTTRETAQNLYDSLNDQGVMVLNIISAIEGEQGQIFRAQYTTLAAVFPRLYLFTVDSHDPEVVQNLILVATKSDRDYDLASFDQAISSYLANIWERPIPADMPVLTDDYAPVESYIHQMF